MSATRALALAACLLAPLGAAPARAEVQRIAADGSVYRVDVDPWNQGGKATGTVLRATRQKAKGGKDQTNIPGTDDAAIDRDPALEIDPSTGKPIVVWARSDATGFNLYVSRYDTAWSTPQLLVRQDGDDLEPEIRFGSRYLHVSWHQDIAGQTTYWRSSFLASTLEPVFGPERIPIEDAVSVPPEGGPSSGNDPSQGNQYFCTTVYDRAPGGPDRAYVWGVRDEPVPFNYRESFLLPPEVHTVSSSEAGYLGGRFTMWLTTANKLYYTTFADGRWADMRLIELTGQLTAADALGQLAVLNERMTAGGR
jgi:hypothetical protein